MDKTKRNKLIDELKPKVLDLSITEVVDSRLEGSRLSPFREDNHEGSFMVSETRGVCTDFVEGKTRNAITFIMDYDGVNFQEAVLRIAYEFSLIDEKTYNEYSTDKTTHNVRRAVFTRRKIEQIPQSERTDEEFTDKVYRMMRSVGLSDEHKTYLLNRRIPFKELKNYFTFDKVVGDYIISDLALEGYVDTDLLGIPGFFQNGDRIELRSLSGIGIPMYNTRGRITAIQLRRDVVKEGEARYIFLSSSGLLKGCTCGAQVTVDSPDSKGQVIITEGQFKAAALRRHFHCTTISVQGVNNIKPLEDEIPVLLTKRPVERFVIAFDADMQHNKAVIKAARKLHRMLEQYNIPIVYMVWEEKYGKGADDVIYNGHADKFDYVEELKDAI